MRHKNLANFGKLVDFLENNPEIGSDSGTVRLETIWAPPWRESGGLSLGEVNVVPLDTISAAIFASNLDADKGIKNKACMLNMASFKKPGGGVYQGSSAQEEDLFRSTNLSSIMSDVHYPLGDRDLLYSQNVKIIMKDGIFFDTFSVVDVISVAAIKAPDDMIKTNRRKYIEVTEEKINAMFAFPIVFGVNRLILGAWGCGAYGNDPNIISELFVDAVKRYRFHFDSITFAVINDANSKGNNFEIFKNALQPKEEE